MNIILKSFHNFDLYHVGNLNGVDKGTFQVKGSAQGVADAISQLESLPLIF